jgi:hemolysin III
VSSAPAPLAKPLLRGVSHQIACGVALVAGALLVAHAPSRRGALAAAVYASSLCTLFGVSALYHRRSWSLAARPWMRRIDHSAIFLLIAGTYTPFTMLLPPEVGRTLLAVAWVGAGAGMLQAILWVRAPKVLIAVLYLALGWVIVPFLPSLGQVVAAREMALLTAGGICYSVGAIVYALRRPDPAPAVFGYHELFHALTIVASVCHFTAVVDAVRRIA